MKLASVCLLFFASIPMIAGTTKRVYTVAGSYVGDWRPATSAALSGPKYAATDSKGNIYVSDDGHCRVRKIHLNGNITTVAGTGICGFSGDGGPATKAEINHPSGVAVDSKGNVFFTELFNSRVREISATGIIQTVAGNGVFGFCGDGGPATSACFQFPQALAVDEAGGAEILFVADTYNNRVRQVDLASGIVTTVAGNGTGGYGGDGGLATSAELNGPAGLAVQLQPHMLWISDTSNGAIRKMDLSTGVIATFFGNGKCDLTLCFPEGISLDAAGNIYVAADGNGVVLEIDASSGTSTIKAGDGGQGFSGDGGAATSALINVPQDVVVDSKGNLIIVDTNNDRLRSVSNSGIISTIAGGYIGDGPRTGQSSLNGATGLALDSAGDLFIADPWDNRIRKISTAGISTIAGTGISGSTGDGGPATAAELWEPVAVAVDNQGNVYISDFSNFAIRKIDPSGIVSTFASNVFIDALAVDSAANVYGADMSSGVIWKFTPSGEASIVAGMLSMFGYNGDEISATQAELNFPEGLVVDAKGNLYLADNGNNRVRMVDTQGIIHTVAGDGTCGFSGDGGLATSAQLCGPWSVGLDRKNNLYIADTYNGRIRVVNASGTIQAFAGDGGGGYNGNGLPATQVNMEPFALTVSPSGVVYYPDGPMVRMVH